MPSVLGPGPAAHQLPGLSPLPARSWTAFAVNQDEQGLWALHISSLPTLLLAELEALLDLDGLYDVTRAWGVNRRQPLQPRDLLTLQAPCEILHIPEGEDCTETISVLHNPHPLFLDGSDRRLAFALYDSDRAVLYTRDIEVLTSALFCWIGGVLEDLALEEELPELDEQTLATLVDPMVPGAWYELDLQRNQNSWTCVLDGHDAPAQRWIGSVTGGWRTGWHW